MHVLDASFFFHISKDISPPKVSKVAELSSEDEKAILLERKQKLIEDVGFLNSALNEASTGGKVKSVPHIDREIIHKVIATKNNLFEVGVDTFLLGLREHAFAAVNPCDLLETSLVEVLSYSSSSTSEVNNVDLLVFHSIFVREFGYHFLHFFWVWIPNSVHDGVVVSRHRIEVGNHVFLGVL